MNVEQVIQQLFQGFGITVAIFFATLAIALPLGLLFSFLQKSKFAPIRWLMDTIVWIVRGTPLMLQILVIWYGPSILKIDLAIQQELTAVLIAFSINYACYFSVIFKGGMNAVPKGQYEACQVLGMKKSQAFVKVVLPQIYKNILPPMSNEIITLVKDTSLANTIGVVELIRSADLMFSVGYIAPLFSTGLFYLVFVGILTIIFAKLEKRTNRYR
ncbi:MAG: amino acid ABC transporter permease [Clostridia bacterium]|nr:amino acid ABC transporter permease [Clostridia bacterium]